MSRSSQPGGGSARGGRVEDGVVTAVLGPTNTGKTHFAIERMLGHRSGMIGFPLRLLARENYDRIVAIKGARAVALITGEERIAPPQARYFVCTVEAMPVDRNVAFMAVDEIQLIGDPDRGHVFTDRLLHARGLEETMFLGADTAKPLIRALVPEARYLSRPRFSSLTHVGYRKLTRLPRRSAVVAFSAAEVYGMAELIRRQRGGTAVVMGALSPRTRNAQVAMYQSGEVDYLVATDAIGMGLNMDLDHVAFARLRKFDGQRRRKLTAPELAQIAGRAGRHMSDGTFGTTAEEGGLDDEIVARIENHEFDPVRRAWWRNASLDFRTPGDLLQSLDTRPDSHLLRLKRNADDQQALVSLARDPEIAPKAKGAAAVGLLWEVCQIPDFRKIMSDSHIRLLASLYGHLTAPAGRVPHDWIARQLNRLDRTDGDIDTLTARLAHVRTWTYIAHRDEWVADAKHWQERSRAIEDAISDVLHERLTQRFVDRRAALLTRRMAEGDDLLAAVTRSGEVVVEGHPVGQLDGFCFTPDPDAHLDDIRPLKAAARRALATEIPRRVREFCQEPDSAFSLTDRGRILWRDAPVARLAAGDELLAPRVAPLPHDQLDPQQREQLRHRLTAWLAAHLESALGPLFRLRRDALGGSGAGAGLSGAGRGIAFQLWERLGSVARSDATAQLRDLSPEDRNALRRLGVRIGSENLWMPTLLKPRAVALRGLLWAVATATHAPPPLPGDRISLPRDDTIANDYYAACGYRPAGPRVIRVDLLDRLVLATRRRAKSGAFAADPDLAKLIACPIRELGAVLLALGYQAVDGSDGTGTLYRLPSRKAPNAHKRKSKDRKRRRGNTETDSPFAKLKDLQIRK